jgi:hypothetical protein
MTDEQIDPQPEIPPPPPFAPPPPPAAEAPHSRWRDRSFGLLTLVVATVAALVIGGTLGAATGGLVGYGVGHHHSHPDGPTMMRMQWPDGQQGGGPQFAPPNGELPPGVMPDGSDGSAS